MSNEEKKQIKRITEVVPPKKSATFVREGYQATANTLDKNNPPQGGSGVPPTTSNVVKTSKDTSSETKTKDKES